ncbi:IS3 family transposase, partial [Rhizobium leguminosarum]|nr:IS3 family transposase [Rhizobium leguminosarum]
LFRLYREEKLTVRKRGGRKRAIGTRAPMLVPMVANDRWSLDFDQRPHSGLGWLTPAEFAQTLNPRRDAVLRSRNGSAPQPAATEPTTATKNRWSELKTG